MKWSDLLERVAYLITGSALFAAGMLFAKYLL